MKNDGGPAFPSPTGNPSQDGQLTVLDWFAGQALSGASLYLCGDDMSQDQDIAKACYKLAHLMVLEKEKYEKK